MLMAKQAQAGNLQVACRSSWTPINKDEKNNGSPQVCGPWRGACMCTNYCLVIMHPRSCTLLAAMYLKSLVVYRPEHGGVQLLARETRTAALDEQGLERTSMAVRALCLPRHELFRVCPTQRGH